MNYLNDPKLLATIEKLREVRVKKEIKMPPNSFLRTHLPDGKPLTLRNYQLQGILHLLAMPRFVLGDDTGLGKCVTGDTLINTDKGLVEISTLNPNITEADTFAPLQEAVNVIVRGEQRPIKNFYYGGVKPTIKIKTRCGYELEGSRVHPVLVRQKDGNEEWVKLADLKEGDFICIDKCANPFFKEALNTSIQTEEEARRQQIKLLSYGMVSKRTGLNLEILETDSDHYFYDPIVNIETSEKEVFDIEVDHPEHSFVGNGITSHNTLQVIATLCYVWDKKPEMPAVIMTTKSALNQWASEFNKFTNGGINCFVVSGDKKKRQKVYDAFFSCTGVKVLILGYRTAVNDFETLQPINSHVIVFDEATAFKNDTAQVHQTCAFLSGSAEKVWSLSATIIKNRLMEAWAIYKVTVPGLLPNKTTFMSNYCVCVDKQIGKRRIKFVVGHRKSDIEAFKEKISPFFVGRPKHEVASELPPLTTKRIECDLSDVQRAKYKEALSGLLEKYNANTGEIEQKEVSKLTAVMYCQQIVNHLELVDGLGDSGKMEALFELLEGDDLEGEKVIIFSRFRKMVDILDRELKAKNIKSVRITGGEKDEERKKAQEAFQDEKSDVKVVLITMAAAEGVNLQLAKAVIFYDSPWSAGDYLQIIGRMIRIGSIHDRVFCFHLVCPKTIDDRVMKALASKMDLIENVLGKRLKNDEESDKIQGVSDTELKDIFNGLLEDAKEND